ncbi:MAG TPA: HtaA domain-containing protein [Solirubrobacterales bacterium]|nr:HtaA domain-containing protein [Solirubrobacterales bacterium]
MAAIAGIATTTAAPVGAATAGGSTAIILANHAKGRTLSGQGVAVQAGSPATKGGRTLSLPITAVEPGAGASATVDGWLRFKRGKRGVVVSALRFDFAAGALVGKLGEEETAIFKLGVAASLNASSGAVSLQDAKLRLTADAAGTLQQKLGLERALRRDGVGMAWLSAKANPALEAAKPVVSGSTAWGMLASWRAYVLGHQGPPPPAPPTNGTIEVSGGATATGPPNDPATTYAFPAVGGSLQKGLYGATDKLVLHTQGSLKFAKPMHCIQEIELTDLTLTLDGTSSSIVVGDYSYDIDKFTGKSCADLPGVLEQDTKFATLDPSAVTPSYSADGKTVTWANVPATLTAAGAVPFAPTYKAGQPLDPVTITVGIG